MITLKKANSLPAATDKLCTAPFPDRANEKIVKVNKSYYNIVSAVQQQHFVTSKEPPANPGGFSNTIGGKNKKPVDGGRTAKNINGYIDYTTLTDIGQAGYMPKACYLAVPCICSTDRFTHWEVKRPT